MTTGRRQIVDNGPSKGDRGGGSGGGGASEAGDSLGEGRRRRRRTSDGFDDVMHWLLLTFPKRDEDAFRRHALSASLKRWDSLFLAMSLGLRAAAIAASVAIAKEGRAAGMGGVHWSSIACMTWMVVDLSARATMKDEELMRWRTKLVIGSRFFHALEAGFSTVDIISTFCRFLGVAPQWFPFSPRPSSVYFMRFLLLVIIPLGQPLTFTQNLCLQFITSTVLMTLRMNLCCKSDGRSFHEDLHKLTSSVDALASLVVQSLLMFPGVTHSPKRVQHPCLQFTVFVEFFLGFVVISYIVWFSERWFRVRYLNLKTSKETSTEKNPKVGHLSTTFCVMHCLSLVVLFGIAWMVIPTCTRKLHRLGKWLYGDDSQCQY